MAISRDKKNELVAEFTELLTNAKTTAFEIGRAHV